MQRFVVISGCSGGGKSALLCELQRRGYAAIDEPGRRIIAQERQSLGRALPWIDLAAFAERAVVLSLADRERAKGMSGTVFFDRGLIDAAAALKHATGRPVLNNYAADRYCSRVFVTPPWPEIYAEDADRRHGLREAAEEYERLLLAFSSLGYTVEVLPKTDIVQRADIVVERLKSV